MQNNASFLPGTKIRTTDTLEEGVVSRTIQVNGVRMLVLSINGENRIVSPGTVALATKKYTIRRKKVRV